MSLKLYPHQKETCDNLNGLYENHRSAGAMMITGGGKSFVAMHQMIATKNNPNYHGIKPDGEVVFDIPQNGIVNNAKIYYLSPTTDIALQIQKDIAQFVLSKSEEEIKTMSPAELESAVRGAFPNLHFICYQGLGSADLEGKNSRVNLENAEPDLVIADEVHRSGAETFKPAIEALLGYREVNGRFEKVENAPAGKDNIQFLSLSATPERDVDSVDMIAHWNRLIGGYTEEELSPEVRADLAIKLDLHEAVEVRRLITPPKIISFDANLVETEQYQQLVAQTTNPNIAPSVRKDITEKLRELNVRLFGEGRENFHLLSQEEQEKIKLDANADVIAKAIQDGDLSLSGKYIVFSQSKRGNDNEYVEEVESEDVRESSDNPTMQHLKKQYGVVDEIVRRAMEKLGIENPAEIEDYYLSSQGQSIPVNKKILNDFDNFETKKGEPLRFITATQKLDEGVHVSGLSGSFMLKPIAQAGENITLRGQSIRFLQELGRNMSAGNKVPRTLFDVCNNVFRQSLSKVLEEKQMIKEFELNENQQFLADAYAMMKDRIPPRGQLNEENSKLLTVLEVLSKYHVPLNADIVKGSLAQTLDNPIFDAHKADILEELSEKGLQEISEKPKSYKIGITLKKARELLYSGGKSFSTFNIKELQELGFLDTTSKVGIDEFNKSDFYIDSNGFVQAAPLEQLVFQNIHTGTEYDKDGKDVDGYEKDYFDSKTGYAADGFNRRGFNEKGIHRSGKIHDEQGFLASGINIQTGTELDLSGFNRDGYKKFGIKDIDPETGEAIDILDVVLDRNGKFHKVYVNPETGEPDYSKVSKVANVNYKLKNGLSIDSRGFLAKSNKNILTQREGYNEMTAQFLVRPCIVIQDGKRRTFYQAFTKVKKKDPLAEPEYIAYEGYSLTNLVPVTDKKGEPSKYPSEYPQVDIDGYDVNGFNIDGIHRDTGTRYDINGASKMSYKATNVEQIVAIMNLYKFPDSYYNKGFNNRGINEITGEFVDMYGFSILDHENAKARNDKTNEYGFKVTDIPEHVYNMSRKQLIEKNYKPQFRNGKKIDVNILGTDTAGRSVKTGKIDESIRLTLEYVEKCIKGDMPEEEFFNQYSLENKLLVKETSSKFKTALNKTMMLYRICPDLAKTKEMKDMITDIAKAPASKLQDTLFKNCPDFPDMLVTDINDISERLKTLDRAEVKFKSDPEKLQSVKLQKEQLNAKLQSLKTISQKADDFNDDRR